MRAPASPRSGGHFHAVRFYEDDGSLCRIVGRFLADGIVSGQPALVVATPEHTEGIVADLRARHLAVETMQAEGRLMLLDAADTLSAFMVDGYPDSRQFMRRMADVLQQVRGTRQLAIRVYGQMVDVLWKRGLTVA